MPELLDARVSPRSLFAPNRRCSAYARQRFSKRDFKINIRLRTIRCPAGQVEHFERNPLSKVRRAAAVVNLETIHCVIAAAA